MTSKLCRTQRNFDLMSDTSDDDDIWSYAASKRHRKHHLTKTTDSSKIKSHKATQNRLKRNPDRPALRTSAPTTSIDNDHLHVVGLPSHSQTDSSKSRDCPVKSHDDHSGGVSTHPSQSSDGYCPLCQVPYIAVNVSPSDHVTQCLQLSLQPETECPDGISCEITIADHFRSFCHMQLAQFRAGIRSSNALPDKSIAACSSDTTAQDLSISTRDLRGDDDTVTNDQSPQHQHDSCRDTKPQDEDDCNEFCDCDYTDKPNGKDEVLLEEQTGMEHWTNLNEVSPFSPVRNEPLVESSTKGKTSAISVPSMNDNHAIICQNSQTSDALVMHQRVSETAQNMKQSSISAFFKPRNIPDATIFSGEVGPKVGVSNGRATVTTSSGNTLKVGNSRGWAGNKFGNSGPKTQRKCPFYKWITGTKFTVDAFSYGSIAGCSVYFLSHFHADHYGGLTKSFSHHLYCSKVTANLVKKKLRVADSCITALSLDETHMIEGVQVTLIEANHCPGSVLLLFRLADGRALLHTGDFRAHPSMERHSALVHLKTHTLYLDTTYCDPAYTFPSQADVIRETVDLVKRHVSKQPRCLIVVGSYTIGKERIFVAIADAIRSMLCVTREKNSILACLYDDSLMTKLTLDPREAKVHVLPMSKLNYCDLSDYVEKLRPKFDTVLAICPTGWTHSKQTGKSAMASLRLKQHRENVTIYGVPYSEHSSCSELRRFVRFTRPRNILPTVNNGSEEKRSQMATLFREWLAADDAVDSCGVDRQVALDSWLLQQ